MFSAIFDFHFGENPRFRDEFQVLLKELHVCIMRVPKEDGGLAGGSAVKCWKAIFAYVAKPKSSSCILYMLK